ncbi:MAG TPA: glycosyltransferase family 2 protein [Bacteroidia bacterium]|nr:glycosyltransferase family 2 protein [Bacteroidia bacterium]HNU34781.1 glycosyltransferase family 2 protein [Bacteroidia bacterium]
MPLFSIITINRNNARGLLKTIGSVVEQSCTDFEYIVIDGASTDNSPDIIKGAENKIKYWVSEMDNGIYDAMNKGISKAKGKYLLFLNSGDCLVNNNVLKKVAGSNPAAQLISGNILFKEANGNIRQDTTPQKLTKFYLLRSMLYHPVTFVDAELFKSLGYYDAQYKIVADYEFFLRCLSARSISYTHLNFDITFFDNSGVSAVPETRKLLIAERLNVQKKYFNPFIVMMYRIYLFAQTVTKNKK